MELADDYDLRDCFMISQEMSCDIFICKKSFSIPYYIKRAYDNQYTCIVDCEEGDIIVLYRFLKRTTFGANYYAIITDKIYLTTMSIEFVRINNIIFDDITEYVKRRRKLDDILNTISSYNL